MSITVSPTSHENTHFLKLVDAAATELGLITVDSLGSKKPLVQVSPYPTMASQLRQGRSKHADRVPPFEDIALDNFSGGLAMLHHDEDQSRYLDGRRLDATKEGSVVNGPQETYTKGLRNFASSQPNLIPNGSFENFTGTEDDGNNDTFDGWTTYNTDANDIIEAVTSQTKSGTYACKLTYGDGQAGMRPTDTLTVVAGEIYEFVLSYYGDGSVSGMILIENETTGGTIVQDTTLETSAAWHELRLKFLVPAGCTEVKTWLYNPASAGYWIVDGVGVYKADRDQWSSDVTWQSMYSGGTETLSIDFAVDQNWNAESVNFRMKKTGAPTGNVTVNLDDSEGNLLKTKVLAVGTDCLTDLVSEVVNFEFASVQAVVHGGNYNLEIAYSGGDASNYIEVAVDSGTKPYYRLLDDTDPFGFKMFEYRDCLYGITIPYDDTASKLYRFGNRGVADANAGNLNKVIDATRTGAAAWEPSEFINGFVKISGGAVKEETPWRKISDSDDNDLFVTPDWQVAQINWANYVAHNNRWYLLQTLTSKVEDVAVAGNWVYISFGWNHPSNTNQWMRRWYEGQDANTTHQEGIYEEDLDYDGSGQILATYNPDYKYPYPFEYDLWKAEAIGAEMDFFLNRFAVPRNWDANADLCVPFGNLVQNDKKWASTEYANVTQQIDEFGIKIVIAVAFTTGYVAHITLPRPVDMLGGHHLVTSYYNDNSDLADAGDFHMEIGDGTNWYSFDTCFTNVGVWAHDYLDIPDPTATTVDLSAVTDIRIELNQDVAATVNLSLRGPFVMAGKESAPHDSYQEFNTTSVCTNLLAYAGGSGETNEKPWIITTEGLWYIEGGSIRKVPLGEMAELVHPRTGEGATVHDVYLIWNIGQTIQSYYAGQVKSIGPDVDYGLPANRRGIPASMASYPGKLVVGRDADSNYSSVDVRHEHGWHNFYIGPKGDQIKNVHIYGRVDQPDQLFVSEGSDVLWLPISLEPATETGYKYTPESVLETSRIYGGLRETEKYYHAIELITESLSANQWIEVDYRTSESSTWTKVAYTFNSSPRDKSNLVSTNNTKGRWVQFRLRMYTNDDDTTPVLVSAVIDTLERLDTANTYTYNIRLSEDFDIDLLGTPETQTGKEKWDQLRTWVNSPLPLTLSSTSVWEDGKLVFIEPERTRILYSKLEGKKEVRILQLTLLEVP